VHGVPAWVRAERLLGVAFLPEADRWVAELSRDEAADVAARLRGLGLGGHPLRVEIVPGLKRKVVRDARTVDARRRRDTSPGFTQPGVRLDDEGRRSLSPERLALALGRRAHDAGLVRVVDATAGSGGNTIGFARAGCTVVAVELDASRASDARHNAAVYAVGDRVDVRVGRAEIVVPTLVDDADLVFVDPPWGDWDKVRTGLDDVPLLQAVLATIPPDVAVWAKLPPSFDPSQLPGFRFQAWFGHASGDRQRVKWVLAMRDGAAG
jgi:predicted RNA methylase